MALNSQIFRAAAVAILFVFLVGGHVVLLRSSDPYPPWPIARNGAIYAWWWYVLVIAWIGAIYAAIDQAIKYHIASLYHT